MSKKQNSKKQQPQRRPRVLVLEGWGSDFKRALLRQGADPVFVSPTNIDKAEHALFEDGQFDALVLTGGGDVDPRQYNETPHKKVYGVNEVRDYTELLALDFAAEKGIPVLGVCRGSQLMAVHNGGKLKQHMSGHRGVNHLVFTEPGTRFRSVIGERGFFVSLHHQIVLRHGAGFQVAARCKDGNIEAIESKDGRCLGVQFHPEMDAGRNECSRRIFRWLVLEAAKRAGLDAPRRRPVPKPQVLKGYGGSKKPRTTVPTVRSKGTSRPPQPVLAGFDEASRAAARRGRAPVVVSFICPKCGMRFDKSQDREDHVYWLHGDPVIRVTEPPLGHADWM